MQRLEKGQERLEGKTWRGLGEWKTHGFWRCVLRSMNGEQDMPGTQIFKGAYQMLQGIDLMDCSLICRA